MAHSTKTMTGDNVSDDELFRLWADYFALLYEGLPDRGRANCEKESWVREWARACKSELESGQPCRCGEPKDICSVESNIVVNTDV